MEMGIIYHHPFPPFVKIDISHSLPICRKFLLRRNEQDEIKRLVGNCDERASGDNPLQYNTLCI